MNAIQEVRIGKYIEIKIDSTDRSEAHRIAEEACKKLLSNPVMEDYFFTIEEL